MKVLRTPEFESWLQRQTEKFIALVETRLFRISVYDYFGDVKSLRCGLSELRWKNGMRVYFANGEHRKVLILLGGLKNGQKSDIKEARRLAEKYSTY